MTNLIIPPNLKNRAEQLQEDFRSTLQQVYGHTIATTNPIVQGWEKAQKIWDNDYTGIDVCVDKNYPIADIVAFFSSFSIIITPQDIKDLPETEQQRYVSTDEVNFAIRIYSLQGSYNYSRNLGDSNFPFLLIFLHPSENSAEEDAVILEQLCENRPFVSVIRSNKEEAMPSSFMNGIKKGFILNGYLQSQFPSSYFSDIAKLIKNQAFQFLLKSYTFTRILYSLVSSLKIKVEQDIRDLKIKQGKAGQSVLIFQQNTQQNTTISETPGLIINHVRRLFTDFEKGMADKFESRLRLFTGDLYKQFEMTIEKLNETEKEQRGKKIYTQVPESFLNFFLPEITREFQKIAEFDIKMTYDFLEEINVEVANEAQPLAEFYAPKLVVKPISSHKIQIMMEGIVRFTKTYKGEIPVHSIMQLFGSARGGMMIVSSVVLLGSQLSKYILPSSKENHSNGFTEFLTDYGQYLGYIMIIALIGGIYSTYHNVKIDKQEFLQKDLERAKETLKAELQRIFASFQQEWGTKIKTLLQEHSNEFLNNLQKSLQDYAKAQGEKQREQQLKLQQHIQKADAEKNRLGNSFSKIEQSLGIITRFQSEMQQVFISNFAKR